MKPVTITRKTKETEIAFALGDCMTRFETNIGFFDHMLNSLFFYAKLDASLTVNGDLHVDAHHTVEDVGIVVGQALREALGDKSGIRRFAHSFVPMDEALAFCAIDISGRPYLEFEVSFPQERIGKYDSCLTEEFFRALCANAGITLHLKSLSGRNSHHITEALFKAFGIALRKAAALDTPGINSTKGVL